MLEKLAFINYCLERKEAVRLARQKKVRKTPSRRTSAKKGKTVAVSLEMKDLLSSIGVKV